MFVLLRLIFLFVDLVFAIEKLYEAKHKNGKFNKFFWIIALIVCMIHKKIFLKVYLSIVIFI